MSILYESRIALSSFRCSCAGGSDEILSKYLKRELKGSSLVKTMQLQSKKGGDHWFTIGYGTKRQWHEISIGVSNLREENTLDRVCYELGWIDKKDWDNTQISWRLDYIGDQKPLSVGMHIVVASREAKERMFSITDESSKFMWVPLRALFPGLPRGAVFVGWQRASSDAEKMNLEKVEEKYMFETFFPPVYRGYVRTLLHLPIAVENEITKRVDFRDAQVAGLEMLLLRSGAKTPDEMFHSMVVFRVHIGVSNCGQFLAFPFLPSRPMGPTYLKLERRNIEKSADIVPVESMTRDPNWYITFPVPSTNKCLRVNMATLSIFDPITRCFSIQRDMFPFSPSNLPVGVVNRCFTWRMKWAYAYYKPATSPSKSAEDVNSFVYISLLVPWH